MAVTHGDQVLLAAAISAAIFAAIFEWQFYLYRRSLVRKAERESRTPVQLGDGYYYIVDEADYARLVARQPKC